MMVSADYGAWIEPDYLLQIDPDGEIGLAEELIGVFITEGGERIESLRRAASAGDFATLASQSHTFRGSALQMNASSLAQLSNEIEQSAMARRPSDYVALVKHLDAIFRQVCQAMAAFRDNAASGGGHRA